jgi:hypothetical protein
MTPVPCAIDGYPGFETSPSVFDAVQTQLGLKLEARTSPVEVTVVDHVERPSENRPIQFAVGLSTWSTTSTRSGPLRGCSLMPS